MKFLLVALIAICVFIAPLSAQNAGVSPIGTVQFFDNNGVVLSGGQIATFFGGTTIPIPTFIDSSATTQNSNPVILDASGRPSCTGSPAGSCNIFLLPNQSYKFVIETSGGVVLRTIDNVVIALPNTGVFEVQGNNAFNTNTGNIGIGCTFPISKLDVCGASSGTNYVQRIEDTSGSPGINLIGASGVILGSIGADPSASFFVRAPNGAQQVGFNWTAGTGDTVMFQDQTAGTGSMTLEIQAGAGQGTNHLLSIDSAAGAEIAFADQLGNFAAPRFNATGDGTTTGLTLTNANSTFLVDNSGDITASGQLNVIGTFVTGSCASPFAICINSVGLVDTSENMVVHNLNVTGTCSGGCGGGGGGGISAVNGTSNQITSSTSGGVVTLSIPTTLEVNEFDGLNTGSALVFNSTNLQADGRGNLTTNCAGFTCGTTGGNVNAAGFVDTAIWYGMLPNSSTPTLAPGGGYSAFTYKGGTSGLHIWLYDTVHSAWSDIDLGAAGSGISSINGQTGTAQTIAGTASQITATTSSNTVTLSLPTSVTLTNLTISGTCSGCTSSGVSSITGTTNQVIASASTGAVTLSLPQSIATGSAVNFGSVTTSSNVVSNASGSSATFVATNGGCTNCFLVDGNGNENLFGRSYAAGGFVTGPWPSGPFTTRIDNSGNGTFNNITINGTCSGPGCGGGGGGGVPSITGTANQVLVNGTSGSPITSAATLTLPQNIGLTSSVNFGSAATTGVGGGFNVTNISSLQTAYAVNPVFGTYFSVNGNGDIFGHGSLNVVGVNAGSSCGSAGGAICINNTPIVDSGRNGTFNNLTVNGTCGGIVCTGSGQFATIQGSLSIGSSGNMYARAIAGDGISCSGIGQSWFALDYVDNELVACFNGNRYRVALSAY